jgi:glycosyltransferase involved in cell wall biosynthesis
MPESGKPVLTIAIPTYNRVGTLSILLESLVRQIDEAPGLDECVEVIVANNCSTDGTRVLLESLVRPYLRACTHVSNMGADFNTRFCFESARGRHVWIIGDDDLPRKGSVRRVVEVLCKERPDLLYLETKWISGPLDPYVDDALGESSLGTVSAGTFALRVSTFITFLSALVVNKEAYQEVRGPYQMSRCADSQVPQLEWVLSVLGGQRKCAILGGEPLLARGANTGGYNVLGVFCVAYPRMVREMLGARTEMGRVLIRQHILGYLPGLLWNLRFASLGTFEVVIDLDSVGSELRGSIWFWAFVAPLVKLPRRPAMLLVRAGNLLARAFRVLG